MAEWIKPYSNLHMFGSLDCNLYFLQGVNELEELAGEKRILGIKLYTGYQSVRWEHLSVVGEIARIHRLPVMCHGGFVHIKGSSYAFDPTELIPFFEKFPEVATIVSHMANPYFEKIRALAKNFPQVHTDSSGLIDSQDPSQRQDIPGYQEELERFLQEVGPNKLLFGTDFPVQTYEDTFGLLRPVLKDYTLAEQEAVYHGNARRVLNL
jgi:predicted TIM-barrel fold metal-dependent hydrolase